MRPFALFFLFILQILVTLALKKCVQKSYGTELDEDSKIVCVCNATYCDEIPSVGMVKDFTAAVFTSTLSGKRLEKKIIKFSNGVSNESLVKIQVNASKQFQKILGFGGAFTDATGINVNRLSQEAQDQFLEAYFGDKGIGYTIGRIPIASCDFSTHEYSYDDHDGDFNLTYFNLTTEDYKYKIPYIQEAQKLSKGKLKTFGSPWSAPAWMKTNGHMKGGGRLKGQIGGEYYQTWSRYFIRFLEEYHKNGIKIWGLTLQNEPGSGLDPDWHWQTMYMSAEIQSYFVKDLLGPQIRKHPKLKNAKIMVHDDQRNGLPGAVDQILNDTTTVNYVDGIAVHWYGDRDSSPEVLTKTHENHPTKFILMSEACNGFQYYEPGPRLGNWTRGEAYAWDIIQDLQNWVSGWVDWNLCLDEKGGPNWALNFVDAPILVNNTKDEFYKQPMYYVLGHFSKFVTPNSARIQHTVFGNVSSSDFDLVAFTTVSRQRVLIVNNRGKADYTIAIEDASMPGKSLKIHIEPRSIQTIVWNKAHALRE